VEGGRGRGNSNRVGREKGRSHYKRISRIKNKMRGIPTRPGEMEFLDINLTDSSLLLYAIHSPFDSGRILKKTILYSSFKGIISRDE
jgi:hypothetical protein